MIVMAPVICNEGVGWCGGRVKWIPEVPHGLHTSGQAPTCHKMESHVTLLWHKMSLHTHNQDTRVS